MQNADAAKRHKTTQSADASSRPSVAISSAFAEDKGSRIDMEGVLWAVVISMASSFMGLVYLDVSCKNVVCFFTIDVCVLDDGSGTASGAGRWVSPLKLCMAEGAMPVPRVLTSLDVDRLAFYAVFDGHGGSHVAHAASTALHRHALDAGLVSLQEAELCCGLVICNGYDAHGWSECAGIMLGCSQPEAGNPSGIPAD